MKRNDKKKEMCDLCATLVVVGYETYESGENVN